MGEFLFKSLHLSNLCTVHSGGKQSMWRFLLEQSAVPQ